MTEMENLYTDKQEQVLFWIGKPGFLLGVFGSFYICYCIARDAKRRQQTFRRLLFSLSAGHILLCICVALMTIPMPSGTHYYALGNEQTCKAAGFVTHWAFGFTLFGHAEMGFYYIFTFFLGKTERFFQKNIEPILHATAVLYPLVGAIVGITTNMYGPNELILQCWVQTGVPGRTYFTLLAGLIELNYFTIFKQMSLIGIAYTVYRQERRMVLRYSVQPARTDSGTGTSPPPQSVLVARETLIQASLFFLSCFIPYALMMVVRYFDLFWVNIPDDGKVPRYLFGISVAAQLLYPLQGIFSMVAFVRPDYCKFRKGYQDQPVSFLTLLWQTIRFQTGWDEKPVRSSRETPKKWREHTKPQNESKANNRPRTSILRTIQKEIASNLQLEIAPPSGKNNLHHPSETTQSITSYGAETSGIHHETEQAEPEAEAEAENREMEMDANPAQEEQAHAPSTASDGASISSSSPRPRPLPVRSVGPRQYTLSGFVDWSNDELSEDEDKRDLTPVYGEGSIEDGIENC